MAKNTQCMIYLRREGFELYIIDTAQVLFFPFSPQAVHSLEILDSKVLSEELTKFLTDNQIPKVEGVILLSEGVIFHKIFPVEKTPENDALVKAFIEEIPVDVHNMVSGDYVLQDGRHVFGVNSCLYANVKEGFEKNASQITAVFPGFLLGIIPQEGAFGQQASLSFDIYPTIADFARKSKVENLLLKEPTPKEVKKVEAKTKTPMNEKQKTIAVGAFVAVAVLILVFVIWNSFRPQPKKKPAATASTPPSTQQVQSATTTAPEAQAAVASSIPSQQQSDSNDTFLPMKKELSVQINNASGVSGQAAKVKDALTALGFSKFQLGNENTATLTETQIIFAPTIPEKVREEVTAAVLKNFTTANATESDKLTDFDIVITTVK
jgi:hypothetical protein